MLYQIALSESARLTQQINAFQSRLETLPPEKLICAHNGKYSKWYQTIPLNNQETLYSISQE